MNTKFLVCIALLFLVLNSTQAQTFTDKRDGKVYKTVKIGGITWFAENLNFETLGGYCYANKQSNCDKYGRLYKWEAALAACPTGWHLSTEYESRHLEISLGMNFRELPYRGNRGLMKVGK